MENAVSWAVAISGATLVVMHLVAAPGMLLLARQGSLVIAGWFIPAFAVAVWWVFFLGGVGQTSPFNINELFYLGAIFVVIVYALLAFVKLSKSPKSVTIPLFFAALVGVIALRAFTPALGE